MVHRLRIGFVAAALAIAMCVPGYASNLVINPTFDSTITCDPDAVAIEASINAAINFYETYFTDPIAVSITFQEITSGLGQSTWAYYNIPYSTFYNHLVSDASTGTDSTALAHLPGGPSNPVNGSGNINVKTANLRAVGINGLNSGLPGGADGIIGLNTHITDIGSPGTSGQYGLFAVAEHEIDEVLGLASALPKNLTGGDPLPEDLFRYDSSGLRSYTTTSSALAYLSIDGTTLLAQFDNQSDGGDYGDWQSNPLPGGVSPKVQDAFATPGAHPTLGPSSPEVIALDAIGYNFANPTPEPSPGILLSSALVLGALFVLGRRKLHPPR
jgi:hypothetical protein